MVSRARVLYELEKRIGSLVHLQEKPLEGSLYVGFLLDGGEPGNDEKFVSWVDSVDDVDVLLEQVTAFLEDTDPTSADPSSATPPSGSPSSSLEVGET